MIFTNKKKKNNNNNRIMIDFSFISFHKSYRIIIFKNKQMNDQL